MLLAQPTATRYSGLKTFQTVILTYYRKLKQAHKDHSVKHGNAKGERKKQKQRHADPISGEQINEVVDENRVNSKQRGLYIEGPMS